MIAASKNDPQVVRSKSGSTGASDRLARALGWFSIGLGLIELCTPHRVTRALGMAGKESLVRAYGAREIGAGVLALSVDREAGLWSRVAGDGLDLATLALALRRDNPKRDNVELALTMVTGITLLDIIGATGVTARHARRPELTRSYSDRSGFPHGLEQARGAARDFASRPA